MLANTTLTFQIFSADNFENDETMPCAFSPGLEYCYAYSVWNDSGVEWTGHTYEGWDAFGFFSYNELGFLEDFIGNTVYDGHFAWEFGSKGRIAGWGGSNMQGGDGDPASGGFHRGNWHGGDSQTSGPVTQGPGTWTRTPAAATVIPLPPASLGLAAGLGLVLLVRRQSRNRIA